MVFFLLLNLVKQKWIMKTLAFSWIKAVFRNPQCSVLPPMSQLLHCSVSFLDMLCFNWFTAVVLVPGYDWCGLLPSPELLFIARICSVSGERMLCFCVLSALFVAWSVVDGGEGERDRERDL